MQKKPIASAYCSFGRIDGLGRQSVDFGKAPVFFADYNNKKNQQSGKNAHRENPTGGNCHVA